MSLAEAVLEVSSDMEEEANALSAGDQSAKIMAALFRSYAKQLRTAVKASGGTQPSLSQATLNPAAQHNMEIMKAAEEFRGKIPKIDMAVKLLDGMEPQQVTCIDGPCEGDTWPVAHEAPVGCKVRHESSPGEVYVLEVQSGTKVLRHSLGASNAEKEKLRSKPGGLLAVDANKAPRIVVPGE